MNEGNAQQQQQNDSWFWEQESSSTSSKKDSNGSPAEEADIDLTTIPLDANDHEVIEKLRRQASDRDARLKMVSAENAELNEKLKIASQENVELNRNIEELDTQHQLAVEKVLDVKKKIKEKFEASQQEVKLYQQEKLDLLDLNKEKIAKIEAEKEALKEELDQQRASYKDLTEITNKCELQIDELSEANVKFEAEISMLKQEKMKFEAEVSELKEANLKFVTEASELKEENSKFVTEISELKEENSKLVTENLDLNQEKNKFEAEINTNHPELPKTANSDETLKKINEIVNVSFKISQNFVDEEKFLESFEKFAASTASKIHEMDFEISKLVDENKHIKEDATKHANEREVLKGELVHYELECSELMKNNSILIADIESLKSGGKLETIMENDDEENIVVLERQLEDSAVINANLEDEFYSIRSKLEETEVERSEYFDEIQTLKNQLADNVTKCKEYQEEIDNLENEKCNYLFELNELKSEEERNILQKELKESKEREFELAEKLAVLHEKHESLEKLTENRSQNDGVLIEKDSQLTEATKQLESNKLQLIALEKSKLDAIAQLEKFQEELATAQLARESIETRCEEVTRIKDANLESLKKSNEIVQDLQKKLLEASIGDAKVAALEETLTGLKKEKEDLITLLTTKHNENVQYHNEIVRLDQLLQQTDNNATKALNDQVNFLSEKCELLAQNLLREQNNLQMLHQEKNDAVELNNTLNKDIERLRQHLLEVADAYTFEQVSLQKQVEEYKGKLMAIEAEAKHSATAYTSANIRANQQAETLQTQYNLLAQQRDELLAKLSAAEDYDNKNQAALTNLQVALEIFQRGKFKFKII